MKTKLIFSMMGLLCSIHAFSAEPTGPGVPTKVFEEGNILVDVYYGFPNLYTIIYKSEIKNYYAAGGTVSGFSASGIGPVGGKVMYVISENLGVGIEMNYANSKVKFTNANPAGPSSVPYYYALSFPRYRVMGAFDINFGKTQHFAGYAAVRAGYFGLSGVLSTNDPTAPAYNNVWPIPIAFGIGLGGRLYFTDLVGAHFEIGVGGGPLIKGGLSIKLSGKKI